MQLMSFPYAVDAPLNTITTYALPSELVTVEQVDYYVGLCKKRRDSYQNLAGAPRKKAVRDAWNVRIAQAESRRKDIEGKSA